MTASQTDGRTLAARCPAMLNDHDPDPVDGFVAVDYINHNAVVVDGREANWAFWSSFFIAFPTSKGHWTTSWSPAIAWWTIHLPGYPRQPLLRSASGRVDEYVASKYQRRKGRG